MLLRLCRFNIFCYAENAALSNTAFPHPSLAKLHQLKISQPRVRISPLWVPNFMKAHVNTKNSPVKGFLFDTEVTVNPHLRSLRAGLPTHLNVEVLTRHLSSVLPCFISSYGIIWTNTSSWHFHRNKWCTLTGCSLVLSSLGQTETFLWLQTELNWGTVTWLSWVGTKKQSILTQISFLIQFTAELHKFLYQHYCRAHTEKDKLLQASGIASFGGHASCNVCEMTDLK